MTKKKGEDKTEIESPESPLAVAFRSPESSIIVGGQYDLKSSILTVEMHGGPKDSKKVYKYGNVPLVTFEDFAKSESKGKFFMSKIRGKFAIISSPAVVQ